VLHKKVTVFEGPITFVAHELPVFVGHDQFRRLLLDLGQARVELLAVSESLLPVFEGEMADGAFVDCAMQGIEVFPQQRSALKDDLALKNVEQCFGLSKV